MTLGEMIEYLESQPQDKKLERGLGNPHSWRGSYDELAFEPVDRTTVGKMLVVAKGCVGTVFPGYKGGDYEMDRNTLVNIEYFGSYTDGGTARQMLTSDTDTLEMQVLKQITNKDKRK